MTENRVIKERAVAFDQTWFVVWKIQKNEKLWSFQGAYSRSAKTTTGLIRATLRRTGRKRGGCLGFMFLMRYRTFAQILRT